MNIWPPFLGAGIRVKHISEDYSSVDVELRQGLLNRNYVGTHFGGSIFAMTDPFFMLMLLNTLGDDYIVWDKAAEIDFKKPGKGTLRAQFNLTSEQIEDMRAKADAQHKYEPKLSVDVVDEDGDVVATVNKTVYIRRKDRMPKPGI